MKKKREKAVIRSSRKGYLIYYLMAIFIGIILIYIKLNDLPLPKNLLIASIAFIILLIKSTEIHRLTHHYDIAPHTLEKVEGIFFQKVKRMNYGSISQLHLTQNPLEKLLNIGTVEIAQFSETIRTDIKNINKPKEFLHEISKMIKKEE
jgi:membrane protein YdbS with pleckstrin-like domain